MNKTEKQIRLCMRIMHRLIRRWYEEQDITRDNDPNDGIKQYGSFTAGYVDRPICNLTLKLNKDDFINWDESQEVQ